MKTSYFSSPKIVRDDSRLVSISRKPPEGFKVRIYKPLCPSWDLVMTYKKGHITKEQYTERYYLEILNNLDAAKTYQELGEDSILFPFTSSSSDCSIPPMKVLPKSFGDD